MHEYQLVYGKISEEGWWNGKRINKHKQLIVWDTKKGKTTRNVPQHATMMDSVVLQSNEMVENDLYRTTFGKAEEGSNKITRGEEMANKKLVFV